jgi:glycosyltransferase involved in cell wall biosynthesis
MIKESPEMRVMILSDINSAHTRKWVSSLAAKNIEVGLFSLSKSSSQWFSDIKGVSILHQGSAGGVKFLAYLQQLPALKKAIAEFQPDLIHAHYASSYGLLGARSSFHPFVLSVWGSDVYEFPRKSFLHKAVLKYNFRAADVICSTSNVMAREAEKYTGKKIEITPFGIDTETFKPKNVKSLFSEGDCVIGTIKSLEDKYGIDVLIKAFSILKSRYPSLPLKLLIVGDGSKRMELQQLCSQLSLADVVFTGKVEQELVPAYHNMIQYFVSLSRSDSESFGVSAVEAMACERPVVVSDVDGFREVVKNGITGFIVPRNNPGAAADAIEKLILNNLLSKQMGAAGRQRVKELYNWEDNLSTMIRIYQTIAAKK